MNLLEDYSEARAKLEARRKELVEELRQIDEALGRPVTAKKPRSNRRSNSMISRIETYVRMNPDRTLREISTHTGIEYSVVSGSLTNLARCQRVTRTRDETNSKDPWRYRVS